MKKVLAVLVMAILASVPAFAAVQNVKVSGDIDSTYINRQHFNLGTKSLTSPSMEAGLIDQNEFITQTRLRIDADLSDNVSTTVGLINERDWNAESGSGGQATEVDLYLAYVTLREMLYSPLTVTVGRQVFAYGNGLILGDGGVNNAATGPLGSVAADLTKRTAYDGIKAVLDYKPLTLDLIYFRNNNNSTPGGTYHAAGDNNDVYGVNANYQLGDAMSTVVEGYFFSRINRNNNATVTESDTLYVPGLRVSTNPVQGLNTQAELAWQLGKLGTAPDSSSGTDDNIRRQAFAAQFLANYSLPVYEQYKPVVNASYTYVSGDKNGDVARPTVAANSREEYTAWDPLNEAQGSGTIYNTLFNLTNMQIFSAGISAKPVEDVTASFTWSGLWAAKRFAGQNSLVFLQPDGSQGSPTATVVPATTTSKQIGNEYDVNLNYAYTEDVTLGLSLGWFVPGNTFTGANDNTASQALAHVLVNF